MARRFNRGQRAALFLAFDGQCGNCGVDLQPSWHGDHMQPYARGGDTDVNNGQPLCPACNLTKGSSSMDELRKWQEDAIDNFYAHGQRDFLVSATPAAGKTTYALTLARQLLHDAKAERIGVIVPTDSLRQQWADAAGAFGLHLKPVKDAEDYDKAGYHGYVATYSQLARGAGADLARRACRVPTVVILDEVHHAGESRAWGDGLEHAFEQAVIRLALTGTPWRHDPSSRIPFVTYNDAGTVVVDSAYEYGEAVADGVCRPIEFHAYDGQARWRDAGEVRTADVGSDLPDDDVPAVLNAVLHPGHEWVPGLLSAAVAALEELRSEIPDAAGLVVAHEQWYADAYARLLTALTGEAPTVVHADKPEAKTDIDAFRTGRSRWLVAVKMVSEGVDIPRLAVGVYAAKTRTPLFFRQVVGRFVRVRADEEFNARLFIPALPQLMTHAREIEDELRHQLDVERDRDERARKDEQSTSTTRESLGATAALFTEAIYKGDPISPAEIADAKEHCRQVGIPVAYASNVAALLRDSATKPAAVPSPPEQQSVPRHRTEKMLRADVNKLAGKVAHRIAGNADPGGGKREVNTQLLKAGFPNRSKASVEQLEQVRDYLARWLDTL